MTHEFVVLNKNSQTLPSLLGLCSSLPRERGLQDSPKETQLPDSVSPLSAPTTQNTTERQIIGALDNKQTRDLNFDESKQNIRIISIPPGELDAC